ncbi:dnaJ-like protein subfamily C member 18 [Senna tora]|uniref:DnaJ-like protein subfamily C member 18 n=1 Tax=Senna tora TaxID=362788 RepID=A0A834TBS6_9FABA|nr:dnaJ-like protein subfamily C member 18 [Senna tora]
MMEAHFKVGPIPITGCGGVFPSIVDSNLFIADPSTWRSRRHRRSRHGHRWARLIVASSSAFASINGENNHYVVLGLDQTATAADIKRAYRLLARKYHPDVSKDSQAPELFKSIRRAYEVLSNEATRTQYDQALKLGRRPYREKWSYSTEFEDEDEVIISRWAKLRQKMRNEMYWKHYNVNERYYSSETEEEDGEEKLEERGSFIEVLRSAFMSLLLFKTFGSRLSLTFSSLIALFDRKLDNGYKIGYVMAWILGGRGGILLTLCLSFASWVCGKTSSSIVALIVIAMWVGSNLARYAPFPQGALLTLIYMSIKLQSDLI